ncbi:MAG: hypothetical protein AB7I41_00885 [Candidatus Sericytochromatia bacterium]
MTTISNGVPHNPYANQGHSEKQGVNHEASHAIQHTGASSDLNPTQNKAKLNQPSDRYEQEADHVAASVTSLPDTQTIGGDIQSIDSLFIDAGNAQTAAPLLQFLTSDMQKAAASFGGQGGGIIHPEASRNELPPEINSNPNPGKDPMLELIEGMKASLRQIGN